MAVQCKIFDDCNIKESWNKFAYNNEVEKNDYHVINLKNEVDIVEHKIEDNNYDLRQVFNESTNYNDECEKSDFYNLNTKCKVENKELKTEDTNCDLRLMFNESSSNNESNCHMLYPKHEVYIKECKIEDTDSKEFKNIPANSEDLQLEFTNRNSESELNHKREYFSNKLDYCTSDVTYNGEFNGENNSSKTVPSNLLSLDIVENKNTSNGNIFNGFKRKFENIFYRKEETKPVFYTCMYCNKYFPKINKLNRHLLVHEKKNNHTCTKCNMLFTKQTLNYHLRNCVCVKCGKCFTAKDHLKNHLLEHIPKDFQCETCEKVFLQRNRFMAHVLTHKQLSKYTCETCKKCYKDKQGLQKHIVKHDTKQVLSYTCEKCAKGFDNEYSLKTHLSRHNRGKKYKCEHCSYYTSIKAYVRMHMVVHEGTKNHLCHICGKNFTCYTTLRKHILIHNGLKCFKCEICKKSFNRKDNMKVHVLSHNRSSQKSV